jgi:hypothetical protein
MDEEFEIYYCMSCFSVGKLDERGLCATCESPAVWEAGSEPEFKLKLAEEGISG